jgi:hypothetical protein
MNKSVFLYNNDFFYKKNIIWKQTRLTTKVCTDYLENL